MGRAASLAAAAIGVVLVPHRASAAACCISSSSFGIGRLTIWEDFALGLQAGHARILGEWTPDGTFRRNDPDYSEGITFTQLWAIVRASERIQLQAWVPVLINDRESGADRQVSGWFGDVGVGARFEFVGIGEYEGLPSLALTASLFAPTGHRVEQTSPPLFAGTTGRGAWGGSLAIAAEYAFLPFFVRVDAGATGFFPFDREDTGQSEIYGPVVQAGCSAGAEIIADTLVGALAFVGEWEAPIWLDGTSVPDSAAYSLSLAVSISWRFDPHWTVVAVASNTAWSDGGGANRDGRVGFVTGLRYGYF